MCGQHNIRATAGVNIGQNPDKRHTPNPRIEIKNCNPSENRTPAPGWKAGILPTTPRRLIIYFYMYIIISVMNTN